MQHEHSKPIRALHYAVLVSGFNPTMRSSLIVGPVLYNRKSLHWDAKAFMVRRKAGSALCEAYWHNFDMAQFTALGMVERTFKGRVDQRHSPEMISKLDRSSVFISRIMLIGASSQKNRRREPTVLFEATRKRQSRAHAGDICE